MSFDIWFHKFTNLKFSYDKNKKHTFQDKIPLQFGLRKFVQVTKFKKYKS